MAAQQGHILVIKYLRLQEQKLVSAEGSTQDNCLLSSLRSDQQQRGHAENCKRVWYHYKLASL